MPAQVKEGVLKVGEDLAVTPGAVVWRDERCELIRYAPTTPMVRARPVVIVPPQINKYYFLDLAPGRSLVEYEVSRGVQVFMMSWRNPEPEHAEWGLDEYATTIIGAIDAARSLTGSEDADVFGFCAGGITTAATLGHLAAIDDDRVNTASFAVTLLDFEVPALIGMMSDPALLRVSKWSSRRAGVLDGAALGSDLQLAPAQRPGVELLGQQLPPRAGSSCLRHPDLECRCDQPAGKAARSVPGHLRAERPVPAGSASGCSALLLICRGSRWRPTSPGRPPTISRPGRGATGPPSS